MTKRTSKREPAIAGLEVVKFAIVPLNGAIVFKFTTIDELGMPADNVFFEMNLKEATNTLTVLRDCILISLKDLENSGQDLIREKAK